MRAAGILGRCDEEATKAPLWGGGEWESAKLTAGMGLAVVRYMFVAVSNMWI